MPTAVHRAGAGGGTGLAGPGRPGPGPGSGAGTQYPSLVTALPPGPAGGPPPCPAAGSYHPRLPRLCHLHRKATSETSRNMI